MPNCSKNDVILVRYPFSDLSNAKVRPAVIVSVPHRSQDLLITPLTSKTKSLLAGLFHSILSIQYVNVMGCPLNRPFRCLSLPL